MLNKVKTIMFGLLTKYVEHPLERRGLGRINFIDKIYKLIFGAVVPEMEKKISVNGYELVVRTGGRWGIGGIAKSLIYANEYEPQTTAVFKTLIKPNMKVVDVGANVGYYTILLGKMVGDNGKVWAFEPETRNYNNLLENINLNKLNNVTAMKLAVSDVEGGAILYVSELERGECSLVPHLIRGKEGSENVDKVRLDDVIQDKIDFIKTDTEGNELSVLRGARRLLGGQDMKLIVELFPQSYDLAGYKLDDLWVLFLESGFKFMYIIGEKGHKLIPVSAPNSWRQYSGNLLCLKTPLRLG